MNDLEMFLSLPDVDSIEEEVFVSERFPKFRVKAMTSEELRDYQNRCKIKSKKAGKDFDVGKFNLLIVAGQTVYPDFNNSEFLKKAGCATATEFISRKLKAGEIAELGQQICRISGFEDEDLEEDIEEAKN